MAEEQRTSVSQVVSFTDPNELSSDSGDISVSRDPLLPGPDPNQDPSSLSPGDTAYVAVTRYPRDNYTMVASAGTLQLVSRDISAPKDNEVLIFANQREATLNEYPHGSVGYHYTGSAPSVSPVFDGNKVKFPEPVTAVMVVNYDYLFDRWSLKFDQNGDVVVVGSMGERSSSTTLVFGTGSAGSSGGSSGGSGSTPDPDETIDNYVIEVRNYCTDDPVSLANVYLDHILKGQTNMDGRLDVGTLVKGRTYELTVTANGFFDSDNDSLNNDRFTVTQ